MSWDDVMAKLTGARLAALDALQHRSELSALHVARACERPAPMRSRLARDRCSMKVFFPAALCAAEPPSPTGGPRHL